MGLRKNAEKVYKLRKFLIKPAHPTISYVTNLEFSFKSFPYDL